MANFKNDNSSIVTTLTTVPAPVTTGSGTIITQGTGIVGTGTFFKTGSELKRGDWIVDTAQNEVRRVVRVKNDTNAYMSNAFTADLTSTALLRIPGENTNIKMMSLAIEAGLTDGTIDGVAFKNGTTRTFNKGSDDRDGFKSFVNPVVINGTSTTIDVITLE